MSVLSDIACTLIIIGLCCYFHDSEYEKKLWKYWGRFIGK